MSLRKILPLLLTIIFFTVSQPLQAAPHDDLHDNYNLTQVVVLSRHNIRAPIADKNSVLAKMTDHKWHDFGVKNGHLTARGAKIEQQMGAYFRQYLQQEELFSASYIPTNEEVFFYANSFQRTIATAQNFAQGMFPAGNVNVTYTRKIDEADPVFLPGILPHKDDFNNACASELQAIGGSTGLKNTITAGIKTAATVLDNPALSAADLTIGVQDGLHITGTARPLMGACDALILQYYEQADLRASFGHKLSFSQWQEIAAVKDLGIHTYRHLPTLSRAQARPLLTTIQDELNNKQRKFTFLCGHDTNIASVLCALEVKDTPLPESIEQEAPIGCKLVTEVWENKKGHRFVTLKLVYPTTSQLQTAAAFTTGNAPESVPLHLQNLRANKEGLIPLEDFQQRLSDAIENDRQLLANDENTPS